MMGAQSAQGLELKLLAYIHVSKVICVGQSDEVPVTTTWSFTPSKSNATTCEKTFVVENRKAITGNIFFMNLFLDFKCYEKNRVFKLMCKKLQSLDSQFLGDLHRGDDSSPLIMEFGNFYLNSDFYSVS
jgi:hypothetical protein